MSGIDIEAEIAPSLKLGNVLDFLNNPESEFHREIKVSEVCLLLVFRLTRSKKAELFLTSS